MFVPGWQITIVGVLLVFGFSAMSSRFDKDIGQLRQRIEDLESKSESKARPTTEEIDEYIESRFHEFLAGRGQNPADIPYDEMRTDIPGQRKAK